MERKRRLRQIVAQFVEPLIIHSAKDGQAPLHRRASVTQKLDGQHVIDHEWNGIPDAGSWGSTGPPVL